VSLSAQWGTLSVRVQWGAAARQRRRGV